MISTAPLSLFRGRHEVWNLWFPILALPFLAAQIVFWGPQLDPTLDCLLVALTAAVLMNTTHIGMTYSSILRLPETEHWIKHKFGGKATLYAILLAAFFGFAIWEGWSHGLFGGHTEQIRELTLVYSKFFVIVSVLHAYGQTLGLSLAYNYKIKKNFTLTEAETRRMKRGELTERWSTRVAFILNCIVFSGLASWIGDQVGLPHDRLRVGLIAFEMALFTWMLWVIRGMPYVAQTNKFAFCLRYYIWPLALGFRTGALFLQAMHGVEYFFVGRRMAQSSSLEPAAQRDYWRLTILLLALFFLFGIFDRTSIGTLLVDRLDFDPWPVLFVTAISDGLTWIHFIWDRYYFRFRENIGRATAGKLLLD